MKKIRVGAVSYLNTKPMLYGIKRHQVINDIILKEDYPARVAQMLINDEIDVGLIPVAAIPRLKEWHIVGNYCIGCDGTVASVCIFSQVPMEEIREVYLDYQSRTSVNLARMLLKEFWKITPHYLDASGEDFRHRISGHTAGVVIGDRALEQRLQSRYIYDLGEAWKQHTGLPFVFAAWIANKKLPEDFETAFNTANAWGLDQIEEVIKENPFPYYDLREYYKSCVSYPLDTEKRKGMELFLNKLQAISKDK